MSRSREWRGIRWGIDGAGPGRVVISVQRLSQGDDRPALRRVNRDGERIENRLNMPCHLVSASLHFLIYCC